jgi:hypothetical protein
LVPQFDGVFLAQGKFQVTLQKPSQSLRELVGFLYFKFVNNPNLWLEQCYYFGGNDLWFNGGWLWLRDVLEMFCDKEWIMQEYRYSINTLYTPKHFEKISLLKANFSPRCI